MSDMSDYDDDMDGSTHTSTPGGSEDPKRHARAQHNALERRRRDNIKDMYTSLRDTVPDMTNERASRAVILKKAIDSIEEKSVHHADLKRETDELKEENKKLKEEIARLQNGQNGVENTRENAEASNTEKKHLT